MALNVPMSNDVPITSLSDAVGKWTQINNQQAAAGLAQQQEARLQNQNERENKMGDLKYNVTQHSALKEVMTDYKTGLQRQAQQMGVQQGTPEYQKLANALYSNNYDKIVQNITGKAHNPNEDIDLNAVESIAGMTPSEQQQAELQGKKAELDLAQPYKMEIAQAQAGIAQAQQERGFDNQQRMKMYDYQHDDFNQERKHKWDEEADFRKQSQTDTKPMPATIVKEQQKLRDQIDTAEQMNKMLGNFEQQLDDGKLNLSLTGNLANRARNYIGAANDESSALASFQAGMEKMRNDSLRLNSGVQTEGDAVRAWNELFANINDEKVVKQRLAEIRGYNESAINFKKADINAMRAEYGKGEFDDSSYTSPAKRQPPQMPEGVDPAEWNEYLKDEGYIK